MELQTFVAQSLEQIIRGVTNAQESCADLGAVINPDDLEYAGVGDSVGMFYRASRSGRVVHEVEFDVAVTVGEGEKAKAGIAAMISVLGLGYQGESEATNQRVSRIKFAVPVALSQSRNRD